MANEFIARNGLIAQNNSAVTGSLTVTGGITGSLEGTSSYALTASYLTGYISPFPYSGSAVITGSLEVTQGITGSLLGTASYARYPFITETVTGPTNADSLPNTDYIYLVNGTHTVTLPNAIGNTSRYDIKNIGTGTASIATTSAQTIDTSTPPILLRVRYTSLTIVSNGTSWNII